MSDEIQEKFLAFHKENPHVYERLAEMAVDALYAGVTRLGMKQLFEVLRYEEKIRTSGDEFRLNNNYTAYYARMLIDDSPQVKSMFELRGD
jgi:hypothetical protein